MIPTGCPDFEVELPRAGGAGGSPAVVKAADFGFSETSANNADAINAALAEAKRIGAARVELAPGTYRCFDGDGIVLSGFTDFTFDGCGAILVFRRDHAPLTSQDTLLENGANVTVRGCLRTVVQNFNMDWENDPLAVWCEGIGCSNIVVRNCRFENCLSGNSWHVERDAPQIKASIRLPPEYSRMESVPITNAAFAAEVAANIVAGRQVKPSADAVCDILIENNTFVNPRGEVLLCENASRVTFRNNVILSDGSEWEPFPFAGKIRAFGGSGNDLPEKLMEKPA